MGAIRGATIFEAPAPVSSTRMAGRLDRKLCFEALGGADAAERDSGGVDRTRWLRGGWLAGGGSLTRLMGGRLMRRPFGGVLSVRERGRPPLPLVLVGGALAGAGGVFASSSTAGALVRSGGGLSIAVVRREGTAALGGGALERRAASSSSSCAARSRTEIGASGTSPPVPNPGSVDRRFIAMRTHEENAARKPRQWSFHRPPQQSRSGHFATPPKGVFAGSAAR